MTRQLTQLHVALISDFQKSDLSVFESSGRPTRITGPERSPDDPKSNLRMPSLIRDFKPQLIQCMNTGDEYWFFNAKD